jgi:exonuclease SbcC
LAGREGDPDQAGSLFEDLDAIRQDARAKAESTAEGAARAAAAAKQAQAGAGRERQRAEAAHLRTRLERRLQELEADRPRRVELDRGLDAARRADPIIDALDAADQSRRDLAQARLEAQAIGLDTSQMDSAELRDALERAVALARGGTDRLDAARALERAAAVGEQAASALADLETRSQAAQAATAEAAKAVERESQIGPPARAEVARLEELALVIGQHAEAVTALAAADARRDGAKLAYGRAQASELRLRNLRLASMAGEMAEGLDPGQPCPVCGATEHPAPAALTADHVTRDQVLRAEAKRQQAEAAYELAARQAGEAKALVSRLEGSGGAGDAAQVADQLVRARAELAALGEPRQLAGRLGRAEAALNEVRQQVDQARQAAEAAHDRVVEIQGVAGGVSVADAEAALAGANAQVADARRRIEAAQAVALAASRDEASQAAAERALAGSGFATLEQARAARLDPAEIDRRQAELTRLAGEEAGIKTRLAEPALAEAGGDPAALEESANRAAAGAEAAAVAAAEAAGVAAVAKRLDESTSAWVGSVRLAADGLAAVKRGSAALIRVADLANAGRSNLRDVDLPTYVLIRRFEEVIDAANTRLGPMSDGQYQLERSDTKEATRKRRTGLALRVMDNATGEARDPRTLSGGETFYVSLALALGLADVVTAEAGGISLETLFVDEGFGSLSEEALESVLSQLNRIRAGGRVVGVISHVEALKQAIPDRIEVRPSRHGGSVLRRA